MKGERKMKTAEKMRIERVNNFLFRNKCTLSWHPASLGECSTFEKFHFNRNGMMISLSPPPLSLSPVLNRHESY